jgi:hypothetical protein
MAIRFPSNLQRRSSCEAEKGVSLAQLEGFYYRHMALAFLFIARISSFRKCAWALTDAI